MTKRVVLSPLKQRWIILCHVHNCWWSTSKVKKQTGPISSLDSTPPAEFLSLLVLRIPWKTSENDFDSQLDPAKYYINTLEIDGYLPKFLQNRMWLFSNDFLFERQLSRTKSKKINMEWTISIPFRTTKLTHVKRVLSLIHSLVLGGSSHLVL